MAQRMRASLWAVVTSARDSLPFNRDSQLQSIDAFTHHIGWFVVGIPSLNLEIEGLPIFKFQQYSGTIAGLLVLAWLAMRRLRTVRFD